MNNLPAVSTIKFAKLIDTAHDKVVGLVAYRYLDHFETLEYGVSIVHPNDQYNYTVGSEIALTRLNAKDTYYGSISVQEAFDWVLGNDPFLKPKFTSFSRVGIQAIVCGSAARHFHYPVFLRFTRSGV